MSRHCCLHGPLSCQHCDRISGGGQDDHDPIHPTGVSCAAGRLYAIFAGGHAGAHPTNTPPPHCADLQHKPEGEVWAVLVNEFGVLGIDGELLSSSTSQAGAPLAISPAPLLSPRF